LRIRFRFTPRNVLDFASHPGWVLSVLRHGMPVLENVADLAPEAKSTAEIASSVGQFWDADFDWDGLKEMRDRWPRKMLVKGSSRRRRGAARGDGYRRGGRVHHGGRQLDGAVAALDALPPIVRAVKGRINVLVDGGVRRGVDVVKALALGAEGVMLGRATLYGACAAARRARRARFKSWATSWCAPCSSRACALWARSGRICWRIEKGKP